MKKFRNLTALLLIFVILLVMGCTPEAGIGTEITEDPATPPDDVTTTVIDQSSVVVTTATPSNDDTIKFLVFADFHYKKGMYASTVDQLNQLLDRANRMDVDFVMHLGDFCNDYKGSPELFEAYLNNKYGIPVFGVIGNHELESSGNSLELVRGKLSNRDIVFGDPQNGEVVGYWHYDMKDFRIIGLDTNYSFSSTKNAWEHNKTASYTWPSGNSNGESLSPHQIEWLEAQVKDASENNKKVIVFSHGSISGNWYSSPDAASARAIFYKYPQTAMLACNGHLHTEHFAVQRNVAYLDVNASLNGYWKQYTQYHYSDEHTYMYTQYDRDGKPLGEPVATKLNSLSQAKNTWFFKDPLSAVVSVKTDGNIDVVGSVTEWLYGVKPQNTGAATMPAILSRSAKLDMD